MTKFEEEVDKVAKQAGYESLSLLIGDCEEANKIYIHFKNWHPDEEFQELKEEYSNQADSILLMLEEIKSLKSQLQQQALPVVPECVGEYIEECKKEGDCLFGIFADATRVEHDMPDLVYFWLGDEGNNDELFARAWLDGYTVEKPQLFYLKNKIELEDVGSDLIGYLNLFLTNGGYLTNNINRAKKFTQQEIDRMKTGSYEQIEVAE